MTWVICVLVSPREVATISLFGRFCLLRVSASKRSPKRMQLSLIFGLCFSLIDFRFADFRMIQFSALPVFSISWFLRSWFSSQPAFDLCRAWIDCLFDDIALRSQFSVPKWNLLSLVHEQFLTTWRLFYRASKLETWPSFTCFELRIVSMGFKCRPIQAVSKARNPAWGIGIWLNLWVSASNELGKPYFWQNPFEIGPLR